MNMIFTKLRFLLLKLFIFSFLLLGTFACDKYDPFKEEPLSEEAVKMKESLIGTWYFYEEEENEEGELSSKEFTYYLFAEDSAVYDYEFIYATNMYPDSASNVVTDWDFREGFYLSIGDGFAELYEPEGRFKVMEFYGDSVLLRKYKSGDNIDRMFIRQ
ncbi:MAG: hypothetical protein ACQETL_09680 [Bacteroidota bacterium]